MAWQRLTGAEVEFEIEDDGSDPEQFAARFGRVASRCDLLLGPYSTQLMREAGQAMAEIDAVLWNQGGSGDDVQALCPGRIVSVLAPTSRYALPFVRTRADESERVPLWVVRGRGRFGRQVARGALEQAEHDGLEAVEHRVGDGWSFEDAPAEWDLFSCGTFEDDVAIVREAQAAANPPRAICSIAAGVQEFAAEVDDVDGVFGIAQWFPRDGERPELGPADAEFVSAYRDSPALSPTIRPCRPRPPQRSPRIAPSSPEASIVRRCGRWRASWRRRRCSASSASTRRRARRSSTRQCSCSGATAHCSSRSTGTARVVVATLETPDR